MHEMMSGYVGTPMELTATVVVFGVVSNEGHIIPPPHFYPQEDLRVDVDAAKSRFFQTSLISPG